jgi:Ankyrin repeats (3 copies)
VKTHYFLFAAFCIFAPLIAMDEMQIQVQQKQYSPSALSTKLQERIFLSCIPGVNNSDNLYRAEYMIERLRLTNKHFRNFFSPENFEQLNIIKYTDYKKLLFDAAIKDAPLFIDYALKKGVDIESVDENGYTPLFYAAFKGHYVTCTLLIERNANINATQEFKYMWEAVWSSYFPQTVLECAINDKNIPFITFLMSKDVQFTGPPFRNALPQAIIKDSPEIMQILLEKHSYTQEELVNALEMIIGDRVLVCGKRLSNSGKMFNLLKKAGAKRKLTL